MCSTTASSELQISIHVVERQWKVNKEWEEKLGKEDTLFKEELLEKKKKKILVSFQEKQMEYTGLRIANFAFTLLYPNTQHWKGEPDGELEDPVQLHLPMASTTKEAQEIETV